MLSYSTFLHRIYNTKAQGILAGLRDSCDDGTILIDLNPDGIVFVNISCSARYSSSLTLPGEIPSLGISFTSHWVICCSFCISGATIFLLKK